EQACFPDGVERRRTLMTLCVDCEVDHNDGVLLHDAHEQHDADQGDERELHSEIFERKQRADASGRQRGQNRKRVDEALIKNAKNYVDRNNGGENQKRLALERSRELGRSASEVAHDRAWHLYTSTCVVDSLYRRVERHARSDVETDGRGGILL